MRVEIYTLKDCVTCKRILEYLEHHYVGIEVRSAENIDDIPDMDKRTTVKADFQYQDNEAPVTYIDGKYQDLEDMKKKAHTFSISRRPYCDTCKADFIFGP